MIELVVQTDAEAEAVARLAVADCPGIEVASGNSTDIFTRSDLDALLLNDWMAGEYFAVRGSNTPVDVVVDGAGDRYVHLLEAAVVRSSDPHRKIDVPARWIVVLGSFTLPASAGQTAASGSRSLASADPSDDDKYYAIFLNALDVMERHNASSIEPKIRRAGLLAGPAEMQSLVRAYRMYLKRNREGEYV